MSEAPKVEPLSAETLAEARGHVADEYGGVLSGQCAACWEPWPCRESRWLAAFDAERERTDEAVELLREIEQRINLHAMIRHSSDCVIVIRTPLLTEACTCGWRDVLTRIDEVLGKEADDRE